MIWILKPMSKQDQSNVKMNVKPSFKPEVKIVLKPLQTSASKPTLKLPLTPIAKELLKSTTAQKKCANMEIKLLTGPTRRSFLTSSESVTEITSMSELKYIPKLKVKSIPLPEVKSASIPEIKSPPNSQAAASPKETSPEFGAVARIPFEAEEAAENSQTPAKKRPQQPRSLPKFSCPNCPKTFTYIRCLNAHIVKYHEDNDYTCADCGHKTRMKIALIKHIKYHHIKTDYHQCHQCEKRYKHSDALRKHEDMVHKEDEPSMCQFCGYTTMSKRKLLYHESKYHKIGGFSCSLCEKRMITEAGYQRHLETHRNPPKAKIYTCDVCTNTFRSAWSLRKHKILHTGTKPHVCTICNASFSKRNTLKQHLMTHTGLRPYICDICDKSFVQKAALTIHRKSHPGEHPPLPKMFIDSFIKKIAPECLAPPPVVYNKVKVDSLTFEEFYKKK